ncbi:hypothetical protein [Dictyobacter formicarum]|uniref:Uncharacterized protein n=1 Tax=Dictyobacter formicarum TaxID=2778368 RepID=A0ABQ3VIZ6_9CHLR|nr:hypothetical protein [Dictyobacter formicarum]GHO85783.1 hypothetical protein KSZ_37890 [Dictyobacter formicarum]
MQSNSQRRARSCDFCGESVAPLYPVVMAEVVPGEQKSLVCHTCRSLGHGRPIVSVSKAGGRRSELLTPSGTKDHAKQPKVPVVAKVHEKQPKAK